MTHQLQPIIVQVEWNHTVVTSETPAEAFAQALKAWEEDSSLLQSNGKMARSPVKTVIRFPLYDSALLNAVRTYEETRKRRDVCQEAYLAKEKKGFWAGRKLNRAWRNVSKAKGRALDLAFAEGCSAIESGVALVQRTDGRFRQVAHNEIHEMLEACNTTLGMFLFLFESTGGPEDAGRSLGSITVDI